MRLPGSNRARVAAAPLLSSSRCDARPINHANRPLPLPPLAISCCLFCTTDQLFPLTLSHFCRMPFFGPWAAIAVVENACHSPIAFAAGFLLQQPYEQHPCRVVMQVGGARAGLLMPVCCHAGPGAPCAEAGRQGQQTMRYGSPGASLCPSQQQWQCCMQPKQHALFVCRLAIMTLPASQTMSRFLKGRLFR